MENVYKYHKRIFTCTPVYTPKMSASTVQLVIVFCCYIKNTIKPFNFKKKGHNKIIDFVLGNYWSVNQVCVGNIFTLVLKIFSIVTIA